MYKLRWSKQAKKDADICERAGLKAQLDGILDTVELSPYEPTQHFERLTNNLKGAYSRRINYHNRVIYTIHPNKDGLRDEHDKLFDGIILVHRSWGHDCELVNYHREQFQ
jgi:Txe/YoeB family toxin of toxin-antitoxin system